MINGVYCIINTVSWRYYVGSAADISRRWRDHVRLLDNGAHPNSHLLNAWRKYGAAHFQWLIVETTDEHIAAEQRWLDAAFAMRAPLYNIARNALAPMKGPLPSLMR